MAVNLTPRAGRPYTEEEWNEPALKEVKELGKKASGMAKYAASKTLAERGMSGFHLNSLVLMIAFQAAWEVYNANKGSIGWDLTTLNPPYVS